MPTKDYTIYTNRRLNEMIKENAKSIVILEEDPHINDTVRVLFIEEHKEVIRIIEQILTDRLDV